MTVWDYNPGKDGDDKTGKTTLSYAACERNGLGSKQAYAAN